MAEPTVSLKEYYQITVALMVLLVLTVGVSYIPLGPYAIIVALAIAFAKAALIVLFFMHVRYSSRLTMVMAMVGVFWLGIMFVLTFSDYLSRAWIAGGGAV